MKFNSINSNKIADIINETMVKSFNLTSEEADKVFNKAFNGFMGFTKNDDEMLEIRRRLAEAKMSIFYNRIDGEFYFIKAWEELEKIGYTNKEREASMIVYRAMQLIKKHNVPETKEILDRLELIINEFTRAGELKLTDHFQQVLSRLRSRVTL